MRGTIVWLFLAIFNLSFAADCNQLVGSIVQLDQVQISKSKYLEHYNSLNRTLTGNLATVLRSEWKAKGNFKQAAFYLKDILKIFAPDEGNTLSRSHLSGKRLIQRVVSEAREFGQVGKLSMRDPAGPVGSFDKTFTYYAKPIVDSYGGKHQVRLRTYVRTIDPEQVREGEVLKGHAKGVGLRIKKIDADSFEVNTSHQREILTLSELESRFGKPMMLYPLPHARKFKLEIKSRIHDEINFDEFKSLEGQNYVQKLSVNIDERDARLIFRDHGSQVDKIRSLNRLARKLKEDPKNTPERVDAIFDVLKEGHKSDSEFYLAQGSTEYQRFAFEIEIPDTINGKKVKIQTTFDYDMASRSSYSEEGKFLLPLDVLRNAEKILPKDIAEEVHFELKIPKILIERAQKGEVSPELLSLIEAYSKYQVTNKGKFRHIQLQRDIAH